MSDIEQIVSDVIDVSIRIHRQFGPGLLESVYEAILAAKIEKMGYVVARQVPVGFEFEGLNFPRAFFADIVVDGRLMLEIKSVEKLSGVHRKQLLTYLRLAEQPLGLVLNFGGETLRDGLARVVNKYVPSAPPRLRVNQ